MINKRILIVEDHDSIRLLMGSYLSKSFNVTTVKNGLEAMSLLSQGEMPDVIVTDMQMPELDGELFMDNLRCSGRYRNIPVIVISGSVTEEEEQRVRGKGIADYFTKPFNPAMLKERLTQLVA